MEAESPRHWRRNGRQALAHLELEQRNQHLRCRYQITGKAQDFLVASDYKARITLQVCAVLWSKEYRELITAHGFSNNELIIWKYPNLTKHAELTGHTARVLGMVMSPDGSTVVSVGADETLRFWECFQVDKDAKKKAEASAARGKLTNNPMRMNIR